jgi:hypothetical protein
MKTLLLFMLISLAPADEPRYLEIASTAKGIVHYEGKKETVIFDDNGEKFATLGKALEYYERKGYELVTTYQITYNSAIVGNVTVFLLKKKP